MTANPSTPVGTPAGRVPVRRGLTRRRLVLALVAVGLVAAVAAIGPWAYAGLRGPAPAPFTEARPAAPAAAHEAGDGPAAAPGVVDVDGTWRSSGGSLAGYRIDEVLSGQEVTVVGRTADVQAEVVVLDGLLTTATITVQTTSIMTDESARDAYFRRALGVAEHPTATFVLDEPVDVSGISDSEGPVVVSAAGTLTLAGVPRQVVAALEVRRTADGVAVAGSVPLVLSDHGLTAPDFGFVAVQPDGVVEVQLRLVR